MRIRKENQGSRGKKNRTDSGKGMTTASLSPGHLGLCTLSHLAKMDDYKI